ncbi:CPBP family intramembrane glutamic endopeptidase [Photobacterium alginatilyticum]|uniref:CPBP family intramembrane glutamic endopeptidase n=1 Tax=Photobacterium alginatilyticum TaxID=1775171 RepID=UPI00406920C7
MLEKLNSLIYSTLGLRTKPFIFRVYGLALTWGLTLVVLHHFIFSDIPDVVATPTENEISAVLFFLLVDAPITETLIFQWFIQAAFRRITGSPSFSIAGSAIVFSLVHLNNSVINATIVIALGFALALTYEYVRMRVGNISALILVCVAHICWNFLTILGDLSFWFGLS